jgi:hypothetical protein
MRIDLSDPLPLSAEDVFHLIRDDMPSLVPYMEGADSITVTSRVETEDEVALVNRWIGSMDTVPAAVKKFAKQDLISWDDHATWTTSTKSCRWRLQPLKNIGIFSCAGTTTVLEDGDTAKLAMAIDLEIYPDRVPGVPKFLARRIRPQIEKFISGHLTKSMRNLALSIRAYAAAQT